MIAEYNSLVSNPLFTAPPTSRRFNADFPVSYLLHPGTAIYVGYNRNLSRPGPPVEGRVVDEFMNDGRQFFVKSSYLFAGWRTWSRGFNASCSTNRVIGSSSNRVID
jgi:hypothetical protein